MLEGWTAYRLIYNLILFLIKYSVSCGNYFIFLKTTPKRKKLELGSKLTVFKPILNVFVQRFLHIYRKLLNLESSITYRWIDEYIANSTMIFLITPSLSIKGAKYGPKVIPTKSITTIIRRTEIFEDKKLNHFAHCLIPK